MSKKDPTTCEIQPYVETAAFVATEEVINELLARITVLESKQDDIIKAYDFVAAETRNSFGLTQVGRVFEAIAAKFKS